MELKPKSSQVRTGFIVNVVRYWSRNSANYKLDMENIISRLKSQNIDYLELPESDFEEISNKWIEKFTIGTKAPQLDKYKWHVFSFNAGLAIEGKNAEHEYKNQYPCDLLIFNERFDYCLKIEKSAIPDIQMDDFTDDIYIVHANYRWTYVIPHEIDSMGPYFKKSLTND